jgi:hypothetical protein
MADSFDHRSLIKVGEKDNINIININLDRGISIIQLLQVSGDILIKNPFYQSLF